MENAVVIVEVMGNVHPDDDLLEEVSGKLQGIQFGGFFLLRVYLDGRLDLHNYVIKRPQQL